MKLDSKIKIGKDTEEEDQKFSQLVPKMAELQVKDYQRTPEEEKQLLEEHTAKFHLPSVEEEKTLREEHKLNYHQLAAEKENLKIEEHKANFATLPAD